MTEATIFQPSTIKSITPTILYRVAMPQPTSHLFEVTLQVVGWTNQVLDLKFPVWTPGSYLVREYAKHLQDFAAHHEKSALPWRKLAKNYWQVDTQGVSEITVSYRVFANELTVRTNHLDATHGYFNPAALCFYIPGFERQPIQIKIVLPFPEWQITTPLPQVKGKENTYEARDFDTLVDSPFEVGNHQLYEFEVLGKPHELAIWGEGNAQATRIIPDLQKIIEIEADLFGELPYERYVFLLHQAASGAGGLEHKDACTLNYSRFGFRAKDKYDRFMQLVAHEFFHLWNVKRLRPIELEKFDYDGENYTTSLWFSEGTTSYYDLLIPLRAGIYDGKIFLNNLSKEINRFQNIPGRKVQPLSESSFDAWIKLYRRDSNSDNNQISYYLKGELVSLLLDLLIRKNHQNQRSFDDVMRQMWEKFGRSEIGFTPEQLKQVIEAVAGIDLSDFFKRYIDGKDDLPFDDYLEPFGLQLKCEADEEQPPFIGFTAKLQNGKEIINFVEIGSPAQVSGIDANDELLAINGLRVTGEQLSDRLKDYKAGDTIEVSVFHQDELRTLPVILAEPRPNSYKVVVVDNPSAMQKENFAGWLGVPMSSVL
ncbi:MAG TPA: M61 family metallopeptidase [Leptolyngbyaceae cyanobacterium]